MAGEIGTRFSNSTRRRVAVALLLLFAFASRPGLAAEPAPPRLAWPMACAPGQDCWIFRHVDVDPTEGARDFACGSNTYDGHKGVDIALRDLSVMWRGVPVLAAAPGTVVGTRDGMPDINVRRLKKKAVAQRECGNGVRISHGGGWTSQYCHLRRGSIRVKRGQKVGAGQILGLVGLSGKTEFPHLHFQVQHDKKTIDPFVGLNRKAACGLGQEPLWRAATLARIPYRRSAIFNAGFHDAKVDPRTARRGDYRAKRLFAPVKRLHLWAEIWGIRPQDKVVFILLGRDGKKLATRNVLLKIDKPARRPFFLGLGFARKKGAWPRGEYGGRVILSRDGPAGRETYRADIGPIVIR